MQCSVHVLLTVPLYPPLSLYLLPLYPSHCHCPVHCPNQHAFSHSCITIYFMSLALPIPLPYFIAACAGVVVVLVMAIIIITVCCCYCVRRRRYKQYTMNGMLSEPNIEMGMIKKVHINPIYGSKCNNIHV